MAIMEQKKCWELLAEKFDRFQTLRNNMQQDVQMEQHVTSNNAGSCWPTMLCPFARGVCPTKHDIKKIHVVVVQ